MKNSKIMGKIVAVCVSNEKGTKKVDVGKAVVKANYGIVGDGHAGTERQISLLALESIKKMRDFSVEVGPGDMAENLTTEGIDLLSLGVGSQMRIGEDVFVEVTQIGKECHSHCEIFQQVGMCVMPTEGIFVKVLRDGDVKKGDTIEIIESNDKHENR